MSIQMETGVPFPEKPEVGGRYPLRRMAIGQSFVVGMDGRKSWAFIFTAITNARKATGWKFTTRLLENGERRIWRVS